MLLFLFAPDGYATGTALPLTSIGSSLLSCTGFTSLCVRGLLSFFFLPFFALSVAPFCPLASQGSFLTLAELLPTPPSPQVPSPSLFTMPLLILP
jgi:hypothetical protein